MKINNAFSSWEDLILLCLKYQSLVLCFSTFIWIYSDEFIHLSVFIPKRCRHVILLMIPLYIFVTKFVSVTKSLKKNYVLATGYSDNNYVKLNLDKFYFIVSGFKHKQVCANIGKNLIWESNDVKLLEITR